MLCNLPEELQYHKLAYLHEVICKNFGIVPVSFRAGRWGFGAGVARSLCRLGFRIDTSVTPYVSWKEYQGPDFSDFGPEIFRFNAEGLSQKDEKGPLLEVPATVGFLQSDFRKCQRLVKAADTPFASKFHLMGALEYIGLLNKVWLSPEGTDVDSMIRLARRMQGNYYPCLNMIFHSTSLHGGLSPFVKSMGEEKEFFQKIKDFLVFARASGWESQTLAQHEASVLRLESFQSCVPVRTNRSFHVFSC